MKFEPEILFETEEFMDNKGETFGRYKGEDYQVFFNMYQGRKKMTLTVLEKSPVIPDDVYYLILSTPSNLAKFPHIPANVKFLFLNGCPFKKLPKIPDTVIDFSIGLNQDNISLLKNTGDLSYLTNLKKFSVTYRGKRLEIGKLPESLRTFSAVGIHGTIVLPEKFPKNLFFIHLHGFDKLSVPDLSYLKKMRILSLFVCEVIKYSEEPPVIGCEIRFSEMKKKSLKPPSTYGKGRENITFTYNKYF